MIFNVKGASSGGDGIYDATGSGQYNYLYNNTIYSSGTGIYVQNGSRTLLKNNISYGNSNGDYFGSFDLNSLDNISQDSTSPNISLRNKIVSFVDAYGGDLHLSSQDTSAKDNGANLSGDNFLPFNYDIDGDSRPQGSAWDIGADEATSQAPAPSGDTQAPTVPTNLSAATVTSSQINLSWTASTDNVGVTGYKIYRGGIQIGTSAANSYSNTGLSPSTTYIFTVSAYDASNNNSAQSSPVTATTPAVTLPDITPPSAITDFSVSSCASNSCVLTWTAPGDDNNQETASSYDIRYSTQNITDANWASATHQVLGEPAPQPAGTTQTMTVSNLNPSTTYYFAIKTSDEVSNISGLSNIASRGTSASTGFGYVLGTDIYSMPYMAKPAKGVPFTDPTFHTTITRVTDAADGYNNTGGSGVVKGNAPADVANCDDTYFLVSDFSGDYLIYYGPEYPDVSKRFTIKQIIPFISNHSNIAGTVTTGAWGFSTNAPRWDNTDPDKLYLWLDPYVQMRLKGPKFYTYSVSANTVTLLHDFTNDPNISKYFTGINAIPKSGLNSAYIIKPEEANRPSYDRTLWVVPIYYHDYGVQDFLIGTAVYRLDKSTWTMTQIYYTEDPTKIWSSCTGATGCNPTDSASGTLATHRGMNDADPNGNYFAVIANPNMPPYATSGVHVMDLNGNIVGMFAASHSDEARDIQGRGAIGGAINACGPVNGIGTAYFQGANSYCAWIDLATGVVYGTCALPGVGEYSASPGFATPGWMLASQYANCYNSATGRCSAACGSCFADGQIWAWELDRSKAAWSWGPNDRAPQWLHPDHSYTGRVWHIAYTHAYYGGAQPFQSIPQASWSMSGKYIYYQAIWTPDGSNPNTEQRDVYIITLPWASSSNNWWTDLGDTSILDTTPPAAPTGLSVM